MDLLAESSDTCNFFPHRKYYRAFLHYLEDCEPKVKSHTGYMRNMYKHILTIIEALEGSGYDKLLTFCHGDAKPNNFLFRSIEIDIEDLECEGIQVSPIAKKNNFD